MQVIKTQVATLTAKAAKPFVLEYIEYSSYPAPAKLSVITRIRNIVNR